MLRAREGEPREESTPFPGVTCLGVPPSTKERVPEPKVAGSNHTSRGVFLSWSALDSPRRGSISETGDEGGGMTDGDQVTGVRDEHYNLTSVLYHALQGAETADIYIRDAERASDAELARFFREVQEEDRRRAARAKDLFLSRLAPA
jgi:hypothetical protein